MRSLTSNDKKNSPIIAARWR